MGTHLIPRSDVKGQDRFFIIFSIQGLIGTVIGIVVGLPFYGFFKMLGMTPVGLAIVAVGGLIGFTIGQVKVPDTNAFPLFKKIGGEYIRDIILRFIKFKKNRRKYVNEISSKQKFEEKEDKIEIKAEI